MSGDEYSRAGMLLSAQNKAAQLFAEIDPARRFGGFYEELLDIR